MKIIFTILIFLRLTASAQIWSIAQVGDLHIGEGNYSTNGMGVIQNFILTHTNDGIYNFKGIISCGDNYEQDTNNQTGNGNYPSICYTNPVAISNWFQTFINAGLFALPCGGNHDADYTNITSGAAGPWACNNLALLWNNVFPNSFYTQQSGFVTNMVSGDSRQVAFAYTNGVESFLFTTLFWVNTNNYYSNDLRVLYLPQIQWVTNLAFQYPSYNVIVLAHYFVSGRMLAESNCFFGNGRYADCGLADEPFKDGFLQTPNIMACVGGHTQPMISGHYTFIANDGHAIDASCWNTQNGWYNGTNFYGDQIIRVWTFNNSSRTVTVNAYAFPDSAYLTNNDSRYTVDGQYLSGVGKGQSIYTQFIYNWNVAYVTPKRYTILNFLTH